MTPHTPPERSFEFAGGGGAARAAFERRRYPRHVAVWFVVVAGVAACGQTGPMPSGADGGTIFDETATLPAPPTELCLVDLTCDRDIPDEPKVPCTMNVSLAGKSVYAGATAVERRGRSSLAYPKANYALETREVDQVTNRPVDVFGFGADEDWVLDGSWVDRSFMRNALASDLFQAFSDNWYAPQGGYCELSLNGEAQGLYRWVERIKQGDARVPLTKDDGTGQSFVIQQDEDGSLRFELGLQGRWQAIYPNEPNAAQHAGIQAWLDRLERALPSRSNGADGVFGVLERANAEDWLLLQEFSKNIDAYKLSVYITKDAGGLGRLVPWDFDLSFGQPSVTEGSRELRTADEPSGWIVERTQFVRDVVGVPGFGETLAARWRVLRGGPLAEATVLEQITKYRAVLEPSTDENFRLWPLDEVRFEQIYGPYHLYEVASFDEEVTRLRAWISARLTWMDDHIDEYVDGP